MSAWINECADELLGTLGAHVQDYSDLRRKLLEVDVGSDEDFQHKYKAFWAMNVARLSQAYTDAYFEYLQQNKRATAPDVHAVATHLHGFPTSADGRPSLQFSFASKLVHMIDPSKPVYDSLVEKFYFLPAPTKSGIGRLGDLMKSYQFLANEHARIVRDGLLGDAIAKFRDRFGSFNLADGKIIDSLVWSFAGKLNRGAIRAGEFEYS